MAAHYCEAVRQVFIKSVYDWYTLQLNKLHVFLMRQVLMIEGGREAAAGMTDDALHHLKNIVPVLFIFLQTISNDVEFKSFTERFVVHKQQEVNLPRALPHTGRQHVGHVYVQSPAPRCVSQPYVTL